MKLKINWLLGFFFTYCSFMSYAKDKELTLGFRNGYYHDTISIIVTHDYVFFDTILVDSVISENGIRNYAAKFGYNYSSRHSFTRIFVIVNGATLGGFGFSDLKNKSLLQIDYKRDIQYRWTHDEDLLEEGGPEYKAMLDSTGIRKSKPYLPQEYLVFSVFQNGRVFMDY